MADISEVSGILLEVVLHSGVHGVLGSHHQGGVVTQLAKVLQSLGT